MTDENYQKVGDNGIGGSVGAGDSWTAALFTEVEKRIDDELKKFKAGIEGNGVVSGLAVSEKGAGANQSVDVASGSCSIAGVVYTEGGTVNVALDAAHGTYARWDIITYDASAGNPSKVTGTEGAIPTIPDVPSGDIILALVLRAANDNVVSNAEITDKRILTQYGIPSGGIIVWSGAISAIPTGWVICDGNNSTPNFTDRFVIHADADAAGTRNVGDTGGAMTHTLTTAELASHTHMQRVRDTGLDNACADSSNTTSLKNGQATAATGSGNAHSILNKYHALAFIMKT